MAKAWKYSALLKRAKDIHSEDEGIRFKLKASAWAIEEIEQLKTKTVRQCFYRLKVLNDRQKWLAHQLEEDLLEIEKDALQPGSRRYIESAKGRAMESAAFLLQAAGMIQECE